MIWCMRTLMAWLTCSFGGRAGGRRDAEPRLAITKENANWVVRWPRGAADFVLQSASDLSASAWRSEERRVGKEWTCCWADGSSDVCSSDLMVSEDVLGYEDANGLVALFVWRAGGRAPRC